MIIISTNYYYLFERRIRNPETSRNIVFLRKYTLLLCHRFSKNAQFRSWKYIEGRAEILEVFGWYFGRNDELINSLWTKPTFRSKLYSIKYKTLYFVSTYSLPSPPRFPDLPLALWRQSVLKSRPAQLSLKIIQVIIQHGGLTSYTEIWYCKDSQSEYLLTPHS